MKRVKVSAIKEQIFQLLQQVERGEEVYITGEDEITVVAKIIPPIEKEAPRAVFGFAKGKISIADDFDAPLEDFADYTK
ncbi:MAG: DUF2281 domain-containing protein [Acidobacteria bacterium]|nr:DUF2281 domain-containing protein [Acidobacteriota bacterium]